MRRVALALLVLFLLVAVALILWGPKDYHTSPTVKTRAAPTTGEVHYEICPPYCGGDPPTDPPTTTTTTAPPVAVPDTTAPAPVDPPPAPQESRDAPAGGHSDAWWAAIAQCESGDTDAWRTGYFGLEYDHPIGGMGYDAELQLAKGIWAQAGDGAWGCSPVAWAAVPGG